MRRIDRILFSALGHGINEKTEFLDEIDLEEISATKTPEPVLAPAKDDAVPSDGNIPEAPSEFEPDASNDINCQDDGFQDTIHKGLLPLCSSTTLAVIKVNELVGSDVESPAAPVYSPLILLVTTRKGIAKTCVESPDAPAYSQINPLATRKEAENNNSPIPPMSPNTLELFETLSHDFSTVEHEYTDFSKRRHSNGISYSDLKEDGDYNDDTESDYVQ